MSARAGSSYWTKTAVSEAYATCRPRYPTQLFTAVAQRCAERNVCVDVGCGTGQAVEGLIHHFHSVIGVDPSDTQVAQAIRFPNVQYHVGSANTFADDCGQPPGSVDLVTVAQAIHWFHLPTFLEQLTKVLKPRSGRLAFWTYPLCRVVNNDAIDQAVRQLDAKLMSGGYWPPERKLVDAHYADIVRFFEGHGWSVEPFVFPHVQEVSTDGFIRYLSTWSGITRYIERHPEEANILDLFHESIRNLHRTSSDSDDCGLLQIEFMMEVFVAAQKQ